MSFKKVFFLKYLNKFYKAFELELKNDGSIYVFLPGNTISEYGKNKMRKISIHSSGRINFESNPPHIIFIDPITRIKEPQFIVSAYIPKLTALGSEVLQPNDGYVIEIPFFNNLSLTVFLSELHDQKERLDNVISLNLSELLDINFIIENKKIDEKCKDKVRWYYPKYGKYDCSQLDKYHAKKEFTDAIFKTKDFKIIGPDNKGRFELIFEVVMHEPPLLKIEFTDPNYYIKPIIASKIHMVFEIRDKKHGNQIITDLAKIKIKSFMLSCEPGIEETEEGKQMYKFKQYW